MNIAKAINQGILLVLAIASFGSKANDFIVNLPKPIENENFSNEVKVFFRESYQAIGITPQFIFTSADRGFMSMKKNQIQAEGYRANLIGDNLGNKYKLDTPLSKVKVAIFCVEKSNCNIQADYRYAIQYGFNYGKLVCEALKIRCGYAESPISIAKMLDTGLVNGVISPYPAYEKYLCLSQFEDIYFKNLQDYSFTIYHFTNILDADLRKKLNNSLKNSLTKYANVFARFDSEPTLNMCNKELIDATIDSE